MAFGKPPDPACRCCAGVGYVWDHRGRRFGTWTCLCTGPRASRQALALIRAYWQRRRRHFAGVGLWLAGGGIRLTRQAALALMAGRSNR